MAKVLPKGNTLYLYGSRARGNYREDSNWDLLLLLDKPKEETKDFRRYANPIIDKGGDIWQCFRVYTYTKQQWFDTPHSMFYYNVEEDKSIV